MKNIFLIFVILLFATSSYSQQQGDFSIGGNFSYKNTSIKVDGVKSDAKNNGYSIIPEMQLFLFNNVSLNLGIGFANTNTTSSDMFTTANIISKQFIVSPSLKYYIKLADKFYYTPGVLFSYFRINREINGTEVKFSPSDTGFYVSGHYNKDKVKTMWYGLNVLDFEFRPTQKIGIGLSCGSLMVSHTGPNLKNICYLDSDVDSNIIANFLNNYSFSFKYYL